PCNSYGLEGCVRDYYNETKVWCFHRNIRNISSVVDKIPNNVININLSKNKIKILPPDVFRKFGRLQKLTLDRNNISFLRNAQFRGLGQLSFLNLSCNQLMKIKPEAFEGLPQLRNLGLHKNQLHEIQPEFFKFLPQIKYVQLSLNKLQYVDGNLYNSSTLSNLDLSFNNISWLNLSLSRLKTLSVFSSGVNKPKREWFQKLEGLTFLSMSKNKMAELIPQGFSSLYQLQQLSLQANALKVITKDHFHNLTSLRQLNLNLNIISYIEDGAFKDLKNLTHLDLGGNRIHTLNSHILHGLRKLKILKLYNNHLHFEDWESPFVGLSSLEMTDLRYQGPLTTGLGNLGSVSMTNTNLTFLLRNLVSLINLSLTKVDLDSLPSNLLPPGNTLKYLKVQYNHFHVLEESLQRNLPMLQYLDVIGNPLSCNCQNAWFKNWSFLNTEVQVAFVYDLRCDNELSSPHLWEFDDKACSYDLISFTFFLSTALLDIVLLLLGLIWQKSRSTIRYLLLLIRSRLFGKKRAAQKAYTYDAFISYSSKDDAWVMGELVPHLEGPQGEGFRLCLHHRDFRPGTAIMENIETAIYSSRHTLCVVSRDFLRSEWCALEFQLASLRLLCDRSDVLLLVFLEEIPNHRLSAYTRLRKMVRRNTYLLWPEDLMEREAFWVRLRNALRSGVEDGEDQDFTKLFA
ncbi:hypothetical protein Z043_121682, partial [Scleropages formosus]